MTNYEQILKEHASPDVIAANPEFFNGPDLSAAVSGGATGTVTLDTMPVPSEHDEQAALFAWQAVKRNDWPELAMLYANVNGQYRPGQRAEPGLIKGVPDVTMAVPSDANGRLYHGLYIELKRRDRRGAKDGGLSAAQVEWVEHLRRWGYYVAVCYGAGEAIDTITEYLGR